MKNVVQKIEISHSYLAGIAAGRLLKESDAKISDLDFSRFYVVFRDSRACFR